MNELIVRPAARALSGRVRVASDKSIGHRALLLGALTDGACELSGLAGGEDNERTRTALEAMGVRVESCGPGRVTVHGVTLSGLRSPDRDLDCGNSGTTMRLLAGLLASRPIRATLVGDESLMARPMGRVIDPLRKMGANISGHETLAPDGAKRVTAPLVIAPPSGELHGIDHASKVASAQVKSALFLAGLGARGKTIVREIEPSRDHTERMLAYLGAPIRRVGSAWELDSSDFSGALEARPIAVPGDLSAAAFLLVAASVVPNSQIVIEDVGVNPTRTGVLDALADMGADVAKRLPRDVAGEPVSELASSFSELRAHDIVGEAVVRSIDELPILAVAAAYAHGTTVVRDAAELRVKESDRIALVARELSRLGVAILERADGWEIVGQSSKASGTIVCESGGDHRIAMACAVMTLGLHGVTEVLIRDAGNIRTSFPQFVETMRALGVDLEWR